MLVKQVLEVFMSEQGTSGCRRNLKSLVDWTESQAIYSQALSDQVFPSSAPNSLLLSHTTSLLPLHLWTSRSPDL